METRRVVDPENLGFNAKEASTYVPSDWWSVAIVLRCLPIQASDSFLDLGCGKGRVMRLALQHPFREVWGVELMPPVAALARRNLRRFPQAHVITGDAREVELPKSDWAFLFQPFSWEITLAVLERLRGREVRVVYHSPIFHDLLVKMEWITEITPELIPEGLRREYRVYRLS